MKKLLALMLLVGVVGCKKDTVADKGIQAHISSEGTCYIYMSDSVNEFTLSGAAAVCQSLSPVVDQFSPRGCRIDMRSDERNAICLPTPDNQLATPTH